MTVGGDDSLSNVTTLPNIIREYTNNLQGYSEGTTPALPPDAYLQSPNSRFNIASVNGHAEDLLPQAQILVERIRNDSTINFANDWKIVTIFVGYNDICDFHCINDSRGNPDVWIANYQAALDYLRDNLPNTYVNVVQLGDLYSLHESLASHSIDGQFCQAAQRLICRCGRYGANFTSEEEFRRINNEYRSRLAELVLSERYHMRNDFTVELQLFLESFDLNEFSGNPGGDPDLSVVASDCLHLSARGNQLFAIALWNGMFQPVGEKQVTINNDESIFCPTEERSVFATSSNVSGSVFPCDASAYVGLPPARNISELKPTDIRVIGAMGDSLTSGFRILTPSQNLLTEVTDYRGLAWSAGGDGSLSTVTTLPNIIRQYNSNLKGFSTGTTLAIGPSYLESPNTQFNVGHLNAHSYELLTQAQLLVNRIRNDPEVDLENDWKVVTIFVGLNDVCDSCVRNPALGEPDVWIANYTTALDYLQDNLPRTFVNVIQLLDLYPLLTTIADHSVLGPSCRIGYGQICPCGPFGQNYIGQEAFINLNEEYKTRLANLISSGRYNQKADFTVELQLFLDEFDLRTFSGENQDPDLSWLSSDCLHFSPRGNRLAAVALWNSMFQPAGEKQVTVNDNDSLFCPTQQMPPVFTTSRSISSNVSGSVFPCDTTVFNGLPPAENVRELKPTDVQVIGAMGDSLTSGFRILTPPQNLLTEFTDYRGLAWSVGGDGSLSTVTTLPNIIRQYNSNLKGFSTGTTLAIDSSYLESPNTQFNVGHLNAHSYELLAQAKLLVNRMKTDPEVNFENDWKVVTIFVGLNDVCDSCRNPALGEPDVWIANYTTALDYLQDNLPRTFVNVIQLLDLHSLMTTVAEHSEFGPSCRAGYSQICRCGPFGENYIGQEAFINLNEEYKKRLANLISSKRYDQKIDFTVDLQLFLEKFDLRTYSGENQEPDLSWLASDCLHLSPRGNRLLTVALWKSMFTSPGQKSSTISDEEAIFCPTEKSLLRTAGLNRGHTLQSQALYVVLFMLLALMWVGVM